MSRRAFTIMEVVVALGILAVALLGTVQVFLGGVTLSAQSTQLATAGEMGRQILDRARAQGYASIPPGQNTFDGSAPVPTPPSATGFPPTPYPSITIEGTRYDVIVRTDTVAVPGAISPPRSVQVEVRWGRTHQVSLETYLYP